MAQASFSTIWSGFATDAQAKGARDEFYKILRAKGFSARRFVLANQVRKWADLGIPDGRSCSVYMIDTNAPWEMVQSVDKEMATSEGAARAATPDKANARMAAVPSNAA